MTLSIASLNSGSNGNCYYIGNEEEAVFIDAGLSRAETETRMDRMDLKMERIKGIFISHEHSDHILGLSAIVQQYKIPVFINPGTLREVRGKRLRAFVQLTENHQPVTIGGLRITPFPKKHDARDPQSFIVSNLQTTVGIFTDIGEPCEQLVHYFGQCHAAFLEANYDEDMLLNGRYPWFLKNRIRNGNGHLSNHQALELFRTHRSAFLSHLLLSHLSKENNSPELVQSLFDAHGKNTQITIASRYRESGVYTVSGQESSPTHHPTPESLSVTSHTQTEHQKKPMRQLNLF
jgi:phosphoribosyl 1,2-cyclic phosphodiesterase